MKGRIHNNYCIVGMVLAAGLLTGCVSNRKALQPVTVTPAPYVLMPDSGNRVTMDMTFHVPENIFNKRSRLVITPQLMVGDTVKEEYLPVVLDAPVYIKKNNRRMVLEGYEDPNADRALRVNDASASHDIPYRETVVLPAGVDTAHVVAVVSTDGCGECTGIDTIGVASIVRPVVYLKWIEPEFTIRPKIMNGKGEAHLQFTINNYDIDLELGNNRVELDAMMEALRPVLTDTLATVNTFTITGMASADGSLAFNTTLARNRANAAKDYIAGQLGLSEVQKSRIQVDSRPEGWQPVFDNMLKDNSENAEKVKDILTRFANENDDVQERYIRRLACWEEIKEKYLLKDRKVEYAYSYTIKSFTTDGEVLAMYRKRPDAFNEEELLRAATLMEEDEEKIEVYRTILVRFPGSEMAKNNLAYLYLRTGHEAEARKLLCELPALYPDMESKQLKLEEDKQ